MPAVLPLPILPTNFVGRESEMAEVIRLLGTTRLLTLTGTGGVGKTRIAHQVVAVLMEDYAAGTALVELASLADPERVPEAVGAGLGIAEQHDRPPLTVLIEALRGRRLLLVLDNCEHLVEACAELADQLLRTCSELNILATSREALGIEGETAWRVPSLSVPDSRQEATVLQVMRSEAGRLFNDRARAVLPSFALTESNAPHIAELCVRLDGIPLAIELAAAWVPMLSVEQLVERLSDALRLLTRGSRTAHRRQRTLRATLDWSYALLSDSERRLFERLSVFAGGWTLEAAEVVCADSGIERAPVLDLVGGLVTKSLVLAQPETSGPYRYRLLEVLRQYGSERLAEHGEAAYVCQRHAEYFLRLRYKMGSDLVGMTTGSWQSERDNANIATALRWCVKNGKARVRRGARVILVDPLRRVLLFRNEDQEPVDPHRPEIRTYWFTPGGGVQPGESFEDAALRELCEETRVTGVVLGACVWSGQYVGFIYGEPVLADERYFLVHAQNANVDTSDLEPDERSSWREFRWWTLEELHATEETIFPLGFADLLDSLLQGHVPSSPIRIFGDREIREAIAAVSATVPPPTGTSLSPRELDVVKLIAHGCTNRQIAEHLVIATSTAERHVANILGKLELSSRTQVAAWVIRQGIDVRRESSKLTD
jgi:predicted ATPase/DNA-binding CsgD family transcriptional regulator/8-oxo-dGTP pyrophosphatase MutT (NUDIX family)